MRMSNRAQSTIIIFLFFASLSFTWAYETKLTEEHHTYRSCIEITKSVDVCERLKP